MSESRVPKAVVDTNLFVSGTIIKRGNPYALRRAWLTNAFELLLSDDQRAELTDVFSRPKITRRYHLTSMELRELFDALAAATRVKPTPSIPLTLRDPDDAPILAAALGGDADYLVTGDACEPGWSRICHPARYLSGRSAGGGDNRGRRTGKADSWPW